MNLPRRTTGVHAATTWFPRSDFARSLLVTLSLLALTAIGYRLFQNRQATDERLAAWQAELTLNERLARTVDLRFVNPPTLPEWLAAWSRQAEVPIAVPPNLEDDLAEELIRLYLPPMSAREALQTLSRVSGYFQWAPQADGSLLLTVELFPAEPELRMYPLPANGIAAAQWADVLRDARPDWFVGNHSLTVTPAALAVVQRHSVHLQLAEWHESLTAAAARVQNLPPIVTADDAWLPQLIGDDPAQMQKAFAVLDTRLDLQVVEQPLDEFAWELSKRVNFPIVLDRDFADEYPFVHLRTMVSIDCEQMTLRSIVDEAISTSRFSGANIRIVPIEGGRALAIRAAPAAEKKRDRLTCLYPLADLLRGDRPLRFEELTEIIVNLTGSDGWRGRKFQAGMGGGRLGDSLVITHSQRVHDEVRQLLAAIRQARAGFAPDHRAAARAHPLQKLLDQPAELVYLDVPLATIAADIQRRYRLPLRVSKKVGDAFFGSVDRLWCHLPQQALLENLQRLLQPYYLTAIVKDDHVLITVQEDAQRPVDRANFVFDIHNLQPFTMGRIAAGPQIQELLHEFGGDYAWKKAGGEGHTALLGDLLILQHWPDVLARTRPVMHAIRAHAFQQPADVTALAVKNQSAPILRGELLRAYAPDHVSSEVFQRALEKHDSVSLSNVTVRDALLHIVRKHQLPVVYPGSLYVDVEPDKVITLEVRDEPVGGILRRLLRPGSFKHWIVFGGTLQTWDRMTGAGVKERWLFDVADLLQPSGSLQPVYSQQKPGQLLRTLDQKFHIPPQAYSDVDYKFYLDRFLATSARFEQLVEIQRTLHALRTGQLQPLPVQSGDERQELPPRANPIPVEPPMKGPFDD